MGLGVTIIPEPNVVKWLHSHNVINRELFLTYFGKHVIINKVVNKPEKENMHDMHVTLIVFFSYK